MKFFTPEHYESYQQMDMLGEYRTRQWAGVLEAWESHFNSIKHDLPESVTRLCNSTLHDGFILVARQPSPDSFLLELDSRNCPWGPRGHCTLSFRGVSILEGLDDCEGSLWLYEEVHLHPSARFDFQVLLAPKTDDGRASVLRIAADEVQLCANTLPPIPLIGIDIPFLWEGGFYMWDSLDEHGSGKSWCYINDAGRESRTPPAAALKLMRKLARGIGAKVAGDGCNDLPAVIED